MLKNHSSSHFFHADQPQSQKRVKSASLNNQNNNAEPLSAKLADLTCVNLESDHTKSNMSDEAYLLEQLQGIIQSIEFGEKSLRLQQTYGLSQLSIDIELGFYEELKTRLMKHFMQERYYFSIQHEEY